MSPWKKSRQHDVVLRKPLPTTTAKAIFVLDLTTGRSLAERSASSIQHVASLTKIVTALVTLRLSRQHHLPLADTWCTVSQRAAKVGGTSAQLKAGDKLTLIDLLHGLLLPSGNDAATVLAETVGLLLLRAEQGNDEPVKYSEIVCEQRFVKEMQNENQRVGNLPESSLFLNPHGMDMDENISQSIIITTEDNEYENENENENHLNSDNTGLKSGNKQQQHVPRFHGSTAKSMVKFAVALMQFPEIETIVNTKKYMCQVFCSPISKMEEAKMEEAKMETEEITNKEITTRTKKLVWHNTNKMLWKSQHAMGLKTGWTQSAGPCLCSVMRVPILQKTKKTSRSDRKYHKILVLTLGSESKSERWVEHTRIHRWARKILSEKKN